MYYLGYIQESGSQKKNSFCVLVISDLMKMYCEKFFGYIR